MAEIQDVQIHEGREGVDLAGFRVTSWCGVIQSQLAELDECTQRSKIEGRVADREAAELLQTSEWSNVQDTVPFSAREHAARHGERSESQETLDPFEAPYWFVPVARVMLELRDKEEMVTTERLVAREGQRATQDGVQLWIGKSDDPITRNTT